MFYGDDYISQYLLQRIEDEQRTQIYQIYVTDALRAICENTARFGGGITLSKRYWDIVQNTADEPQRTSDDIIASVCDGLNELGKEEITDECI